MASTDDKKAVSAENVKSMLSNVLGREMLWFLPSGANTELVDFMADQTGFESLEVTMRDQFNTGYKQLVVPFKAGTTKIPGTTGGTVTVSKVNEYIWRVQTAHGGTERFNYIFNVTGIRAGGGREFLEALRALIEGVE